jgi:protocatechuate 3,4-dioxygenase, alpha subunit
VAGIHSRAMLRLVYTRLYFSDEPANASDPILTMVPEDRRGTLIAHKLAGGQPVYRFEIRMGAKMRRFYSRLDSRNQTL